MENNRGEALLEIIRQGLELSGEQDSQAILGRRDSYLGLSDLARYSECPRAATAAKVFPQENSLASLLTLQRGHWFEKGISDCFSNIGMKFLPQLEIGISHGGVPIRGYLDFTFVWDKPAVRVLEIKSVAKLPEEPYSGHVFQAQAQINLLAQFWNEPVFTLRDSSGTILSQNLSFPQICSQNLNVHLSNDPNAVSVESWLLCLSMREAASFGPYTYDSQSMEELFSLAKECWAEYGILRHNALAVNNLPHVLGYHPLCGCCQFNADCPKFQSVEFQPQWEEDISRHEKLKSSRTALDAEIKEIEAALKQACCKDWINTGSHRFRVASIAGRRTLDKESLREELLAIFNAGGMGVDVDALLARHEKVGAASARLNIMAVK